MGATGSAKGLHPLLVINRSLFCHATRLFLQGSHTSLMVWFKRQESPCGSQHFACLSLTCREQSQPFLYNSAHVRHLGAMLDFLSTWERLLFGRRSFTKMLLIRHLQTVDGCISTLLVSVGSVLMVHPGHLLISKGSQLHVSFICHTNGVFPVFCPAQFFSQQKTLESSSCCDFSMRVWHLQKPEHFSLAVLYLAFIVMLFDSDFSYICRFYFYFCFNLI